MTSWYGTLFFSIENELKTDGASVGRIYCLFVIRGIICLVIALYCYCPDTNASFYVVINAGCSDLASGYINDCQKNK